MEINRDTIDCENRYINRKGQYVMRRMAVLLPLLLVMPSGVQADGSAPCNAKGFKGTECGVDAYASGNFTTAVGDSTEAIGAGSTAVGFNADAKAVNSTAVGVVSDAIGASSTAMGYSAAADAAFSTSVGAYSAAAAAQASAFGMRSFAYSANATALGFAAGYNGNSPITDSPASIAIGYYANISTASPGAIAIGGSDGPVSNSTRGAQSTGENAIAIGFKASANQPGSIALGANVSADKANTMTVGVPIEIKRDDGTTQILINEKSAGNAVRTLFNVVCDTCTPGFRFNQTLPSNNTWFFRMLQSGNFSVDDPATIAKEAEFRSGGDLRIGGTLIQASSREIKTGFIELDNSEILEKVKRLPITQWSYNKDQGKVKHIGPMAEDFYALFDVGLNNKGLSSVDTTGVALAAIKALTAENDQLKKRISDLESQSSEISELKLLITRLMSKDTEAQLARVTFH